MDRLNYGSTKLTNDAEDIEKWKQEHPLEFFEELELEDCFDEEHGNDLPDYIANMVIKPGDIYVMKHNSSDKKLFFCISSNIKDGPDVHYVEMENGTFSSLVWNHVDCYSNIYDNSFEFPAFKICKNDIVKNLSISGEWFTRDRWLNNETTEYIGNAGVRLFNNETMKSFIHRILKYIYIEENGSVLKKIGYKLCLDAKPEVGIGDYWRAEANGIDICIGEWTCCKDETKENILYRALKNEGFTEKDALDLMYGNEFFKKPDLEVASLYIYNNAHGIKLEKNNQPIILGLDVNTFDDLLAKYEALSDVYVMDFKTMDFKEFK